MHPNPAGGQRAWKVWGCIAVRSPLVGVAATIAGGLFAAVCGAVQCLTDGLPWAYAGAWGVRGAIAGLAAGTIMGAVSGIYHVEESAQRKPAPAEQRMVKAAPLLARVAAFFRGAPARN